MFEYADAMRQIVNDRSEELRRSAARSRRTRRRHAPRRFSALLAAIVRH